MNTKRIMILGGILFFSVFSCKEKTLKTENVKDLTPIIKTEPIDSVLDNYHLVLKSKKLILRSIPRIENEESCNSIFEVQHIHDSLKEHIEVPKGNYQLVKGRIIKETFLLLYKKADERDRFLLASYFFPWKEIQDSIPFSLKGCNNESEFQTKLLPDLPFRVKLISKDTVSYIIKSDGEFKREITRS